MWHVSALSLFFHTFLSHSHSSFPVPGCLKITWLLIYKCRLSRWLAVDDAEYQALMSSYTLKAQFYTICLSASSLLFKGEWSLPQGPHCM